ncbi:MAG: aminodeoxychorismate/anthranilate synthase component II [Acidobacteriota bacterium]
MILLIDNYDSFTYNLVQLLREAGADVTVVRNDVESVDQLLARRPSGIVISPGPGRPEDAGVSLDLYASDVTVPVLGVCLGHQCLGQAFGAEVVRAPRLMHGKTSPVRHDERQPLLDELPNPFQATRYHSLVIDPPSLPDVLEPFAWSTDDDMVMAMRHREKPFWGVQFHPESVLTDVGPRLLANFLRLCGVESPQIPQPILAAVVS